MNFFSSLRTYHERRNCLFLGTDASGERAFAMYNLLGWSETASTL